MLVILDISGKVLDRSRLAWNAYERGLTSAFSRVQL